MEPINKTIKAKREEVGLTQLEVSRRTGLTVVTLSRIENGAYTPPLETIGKIFAAMGFAVNIVIEPLDCPINN